MSSDQVRLEAARLALKFLVNTDPVENERSFLTALKSVDDPHERISVAFNAARILAWQLREAAQIAGTLDQMTDQVNKTLFDLVLPTEEEQP